MKIDLSRDQIIRLRKQRDQGMTDAEVNREAELQARISQDEKADRFITKDDLLAVAGWKWRGGITRKLCDRNDEETVAEITRAAFSGRNKYLRIAPLLLLQGVSWPMASVILHFAFPKRYPILDMMAMKAIGYSGDYNFSMWKDYVDLCQETAKQHRVSLRTLDKALWMTGKGLGGPHE